MTRYCSECDSEMELTYEVDRSNIEYEVWVCPECKNRRDNYREPDADLMYEQMRDDGLLNR